MASRLIVIKQPIKVLLGPPIRRGRGRPKKVRPAIESVPSSVSRNLAKRDESSRRALAMETEYRAGKTLEEIGKNYGITRERVRQILVKHGVSRSDGGAAKASEDKKAARKQRLDDYCFRKYGMSRAEYLSIKPSARLAFTKQRSTAKARGIGWAMNLAEWWAVWQTSGKWSQRGRGDGYVMARHGDTGPYSTENVYICTASQNIKDSYVFKPKSERKFTGRSGKVLCHRGELLTISQWSKKLGVPVTTLQARIDRGWTLDAALSTPVQKTHKGK